MRTFAKTNQKNDSCGGYVAEFAYRWYGLASYQSKLSTIYPNTILSAPGIVKRIFLFYFYNFKL